jgi:hypothetical protein
MSEEPRVQQPLVVQQVVQNPPGNGLAVAGFVLSLIAAIFSFIPFVNVVSWPAAILGLIFGAVGINKARKTPGAPGKGLAITAVVLACIGLGMVIIATIATAGAVNSML